MTVDEILGRIRRLESGGNYRAANPHSSARGAYQFIGSTWRGLTARYGIGTQYREAHLAPPEVQDAVARRYVEQILAANGGNPEAVPATWYVGNYDPNNLDYVPAPGSGNTLTVRGYIDRWMGGSGGTPTAQKANPMTRDQLAQRVRDQYPAYAWLLDVPEVGDLLLEAVDPNVGFDEATLRARLYDTAWWKSNSETMRAWETLKATDPQTAVQRQMEVGAEAKRRARQLGVEIDDTGLGLISDAAMRFGWSGSKLAAEIDRFLLAAARKTGGGEAGAHEDQARALAARYLVPISDTKAREYGDAVLSGEMTWDGVIATLSDQAKAMYPSLGDALDTGITPADFAEPYRQIAAQTLEVGASSIDMADPRFLRALNGGEGRAPMSLSDWQTVLRSDRTYGWHKTADARAQAYEMGRELMRAFGRTK